MIERISPGLGPFNTEKDLNKSLEILFEHCQIGYEGNLRARVYYDHIHIYPIGSSRVMEVKNNPEHDVRLKNATPEKVVIGRFKQSNPHNYVIHFVPIDENGSFKPI